jgi:hypothetical protein
MGFVKSASTSTPVVNSKGEVERILRRYGADGLAVAQNYGEGTILVSFIVPNSLDHGAPLVPVKLPVDVVRVFNALFPRKTPWTLELARSKQNEKAWAQAERVAWRNLVLWIDAALSAVQCGLQTITEAFFAHAVLSGDGRRVIDVAKAGEPIYRQLSAGAAPPEGTP